MSLEAPPTPPQLRKLRFQSMSTEFRRSQTSASSCRRLLDWQDPEWRDSIPPGRAGKRELIFGAGLGSASRRRHHGRLRRVGTTRNSLVEEKGLRGQQHSLNPSRERLKTRICDGYRSQSDIIHIGSLDALRPRKVNQRGDVRCCRHVMGPSGLSSTSQRFGLFQIGTLMLSHRGWRSGSAMAARWAALSSIRTAFLK